MIGKFIIHISGPGCSGKSSLADALATKFPGTYLVAFDKLKWQLSGYHRDKPWNGDTVRDIQWGLLGVVIKQQIPIVTEIRLSSEIEYARLKEMIEQQNYELICVELTAPRDVLLKRFRERVANAKKMGTRISLTDEVVYLDKLSKKSFVPADTAVFDTSVVDVKEVAEKIASQLSSAGLI